MHQWSKQAAQDKRTIVKSSVLVDVLQNGTGYDLFCQFIAHEFSVECLSAVTEFIMYQEYVCAHVRVDDPTQRRCLLKHILGSHAYPLTFPDSVPRSSIVFGTTLDNVKEQYAQQNISWGQDLILGDEHHDHTQLLVKVIALKLFYKYITYDSQYPLNISGNTRKQLKIQMHNSRKWLFEMREVSVVHLLTLFNDACLETWRLLQDSFTRFQQTVPYRTLNHTLAVNMTATEN